MAKIFVSYAREDQRDAQLLADTLRSSGMDVFLDQSISAGAEFSDVVGQTLANANVVVLLLSRNSNRHKYVNSEVNAALQQGHPIIPVLLDDEATENYVWPLVSDRQAIKVESPEQLREVVTAVNHVLYGTSRTVPALASRSRTLFVAILSAIIGAFIAGVLVALLAF